MAVVNVFQLFGYFITQTLYRAYHSPDPCSLPCHFPNCRHLWHEKIFNKVLLFQPWNILLILYNTAKWRLQINWLCLQIPCSTLFCADIINKCRY